MTPSDRQSFLWQLIGPVYGAPYTGLLDEYETQGWTEADLAHDLAALAGWIEERPPGVWQRVTA